MFKIQFILIFLLTISLYCTAKSVIYEKNVAELENGSKILVKRQADNLLEEMNTNNEQIFSENQFSDMVANRRGGRRGCRRCYG